MPNLTIVPPTNNTELDQEFIPLPHYGWDERPSTLEITYDEAATAIHLGYGDLSVAADLLKVPLHRLTRLIRRSPRLGEVWREARDHLVLRAASIAIATLFDSEADHRRKEWASTKILTSKLAQESPFSPASGGDHSVTISQDNRSVVYRWGEREDDQG